MATICLSNGMKALIDDEDFFALSLLRWRPVGNGYAATTVRFSSNPAGRTNQYMHRLVVGLQPGDKRIVDHVNGNILDNRKANLRVCGWRENGWNSSIRSHNRSGFKGVIWEPRRNKWQAYINIDGKQKYLGLYQRAEAAHAAYCTAAAEYFGEFARGS